MTVTSQNAHAYGRSSINTKQYDKKQIDDTVPILQHEVPASFCSKPPNRADTMEFKKNLVFSVIDNMSAAITFVDLKETKVPGKVRIVIKFDTTNTKKDKAQRQKLRGKINQVKRMRSQIARINISGGVFNMDIHNDV